MLAKIDERTKESRLLAAARAELTSHVSSPTSTQRTLIERAARCMLYLDVMDRETLAAGTMSERNSRQYLAWQNSLRLCLRELGRQAAPAVAPPSLANKAAVNEDHVPAGEFLAARHLLPDELAIMNDELDVEALHPAAGLALAAVGLLDVAEPLAEHKIGLLDRILQERPVDPVGERVNERRVAFELGEAERGPERPDQRIHDVSDDVLGVIEFNA